MIITQLREKLRVLEGDLQMIAESKQELEQEKNSQIDELSRDICELTLENTINMVQIQSLKSELKQMVSAPSECDQSSSLDLRDCTNLSLSVVKRSKALGSGRASRKWLNAVARTQSQIFNVPRFNAFIDIALKPNSDYTQTTKTFTEYHNRLSSQSNRYLPAKSNAVLPPAEYEEVKSVLDNLLFIVEVEYEIESKVALDLSLVNIDRHLEGKLNKKVSKFASPSKYSSVQSYRNISTPQKLTRITEVPSTEIFAMNYSSRIQKLAQDSYYNNIQNYIYCGTKSLERMLAREENIEGYEGQLVVELSEMLLNSYNYNQYLMNQW